MYFNDISFLLVEDDENTRMLMKKLLENLGAEVMEAAEIKTAKDILKDKMPDMIILDLNYDDGEDGYDFLWYRNETKTLLSVPVVIFSADDDELSIVRAIKLGATDYLVKPLQAMLFLQKIRKIFLKQKKKQTDLRLVYKKPFSCEVVLDGELIRFNSKEAVFEGPIRIDNSDKHFILEPEFLSGTEVNDIVCRKAKLARSSCKRGHYMNKCTFVGVSDSVVQTIKKIVRAWR